MRQQRWNELIVYLQLTYCIFTIYFTPSSRREIKNWELNLGLSTASIRQVSLDDNWWRQWLSIKYQWNVLHVRFKGQNIGKRKYNVLVDENKTKKPGELVHFLFVIIQWHGMPARRFKWNQQKDSNEINIKTHEINIAKGLGEGNATFPRERTHNSPRKI